MTEKIKIMDIWDQMEKIYKIDGLGEVKAVETISSGSYVLDDALGPWGLPKGRLIQYAGAESCGKTLMSLEAIKNWQNLDPKNWAIFIDVEASFTKEWAEMLGIDGSRLKVIQEQDAANIFTYLCGVPHKDMGKDKAKLGLLDMIKEAGGAEESGLGIIVLDSVAQMISPIEATKVVGNTNVSPMARFLPDALRRLKPLLSQTGVIFIAINQVRTNIGQMYGDPTSTPGGHAWKHNCDVMVHFTKSASKQNMFFDELGQPYGHIASARVDKNKVGPPRRICSFDLEYTNGVVNEHKEIFDLAVKYGVIQRPTKTTYQLDDEKWVGREKAAQAIAEKDLHELFEKIKHNKAQGISTKELQEE